MAPRSLAIFVGLFAFAGVAFALTRRPAAEGDVLAGGGWDAPNLIVDAAQFAADSIEGMVMDQQHLSADGLRRLAEEEGFSATPYSDFKGNSIGHGHLIRPGESLTYVTREQARDLLLSDVAWAEAAVRSAVDVQLQQHQFDALVSFAFNVGASAFGRSTLVKKLNAGDLAGAAAEFPRWNLAGGAVLPTLVARRARERATFEA